MRDQGLDASKDGDRATARHQLREHETQQWMKARKNDVVDSEAVLRATPRTGMITIRSVNQSY
jgi:hypothetical protein